MKTVRTVKFNKHDIEVLADALAFAVFRAALVGSKKQQDDLHKLVFKISNKKMVK